jgi:hypothetical protein
MKCVIRDVWSEYVDRIQVPERGLQWPAYYETSG